MKVRQLNQTMEKINMRLILICIAIHSFIVGAALILFPGQWLEFFGFQLVRERFFQTQAGVFHMIMGICYVLPAINYDHFKSLVLFSVIVKLCATLFLLIYFIFFDSIFLVLLSGLGDCAMAVLLIYVYNRKPKKNE